MSDSESLTREGLERRVWTLEQERERLKDLLSMAWEYRDEDNWSMMPPGVYDEIEEALRRDKA